LELENNNLKAELSALRSQLDGLQRRTEDMRMRNRELEESVNKLMDSKSELEQLQTQKDELFAMLIHDIKNPAGIIKSLVELLRSYDLSATDQQSIIDDILSTTKVIVQLSQEVSRVLALEGGKLNMDFRVANLNGICKNVYNRFKVKSNEKSISFLYDVPDGLPDIKLDDGKIDEVLSNLVSNAIKFTQKGGSIRLKAQQIDATVVIEVSDNGLGLSEEDLNSAFKRGAQLSAKPTGGESSTGLGLWIVKKLVEAHNGRVWVRSSLGKGSTFAFSLPLEQKDATKVVMMN
jgi:signal transduction histidine kinase